MATMRDIAERAGVSIKTVSRALNDDGYVEKNRKELIRSIAEELYYTPNLHARTLKTRQSHEVVVPLGTTDELHMTKLAGLAESLRGEGYIVSLSFLQQDLTERERCLHTGQLLARNPAGFVLLSPSVDLVIHWEQVCRSVDLPLVVVDAPSLRETDSGDVTTLSTPLDMPFNIIRLDRGRGVREAIKYLADRGYARIAYAGPRRDITRLTGYLEAMVELGREPLVFETDVRDRRTDYRMLADMMIDAPVSPDAVQMYSDEAALYYISRLHERRVRIPEDIAVVGFDDRWAAEKASPALTTVAQPSMELGEMAGRMIVKAIRRELDPGGEFWSTATRLVVRDST